MDDSSLFLDIIFFAMIAAFLVLRLRSVLGRRTGNEKPRRSPYDPQAGRGQPQDDKVVDLSGRRPRPDSLGDEDDTAAAKGAWGRPVEAGGVDAIIQADPGFDVDTFLSGARGAFEMIVAAFANGDKPTLQPLLSDEVYRNFAAAIDERASAGETMETEVFDFKSVSLREGRLDARVALVTVEFVTEQINVVRDKAGTVVDGDADHIAKVTDLWTFARDTTSSDPNWVLVATRTPEDD